MKKGGKVIFGRDQHCTIIGIGRVSLKPSLYISNVLLVDGLNHNLFSISQLCHNGCEVVFDKNKCIINKYGDTHLFISKRQGNLYKIDIMI